MFSVCSLIVYNGTCWLKPLHIYANCCHVWNRHIRKFSSDFTTLLVGTVFSTCIIDIHVALRELMTWLQITHRIWWPLWHAVR
jgi:hypothetical protein